MDKEVESRIHSYADAIVATVTLKLSSESLVNGAQPIDIIDFATVQPSYLWACGFFLPTLPVGNGTPSARPLVYFL